MEPLVFLVYILETSMTVEVIKEMMEDKNREVGEDMRGSTVCFADDTTVLLSASTDIKLCHQEHHCKDTVSNSHILVPWWSGFKY